MRPSARTPIGGLAAAQGFFRRVSTAPQAALLLDYDGTLAPFRPDRGKAEPFEGVRERLASIVEHGRTHVAIVTGRVANDLDALLRVRPRPEIWGSHGFEHWPSGQGVRAMRLGAAGQAVVDREFEWARAQGWGDRVERKPIGVAIHWRGLDDGARKRMRQAAEARWVVPPVGFGLRPFDGGLELRTMAATKARAVEGTKTILGARVPIAYLGDDVTDEDAFGALSGGDLSVLVRPEHRATAATVWLRPPEELLSFLDAWRDARNAPNR